MADWLNHDFYKIFFSSVSLQNTPYLKYNFEISLKKSYFYLFHLTTINTASLNHNYKITITKNYIFSCYYLT